MAAIVLSTAVVFAFTACSGARDAAEAFTLEPNATVVRVVDGDTILVKSEGEKERVRLIGINTPETVDPRRPVMCFGKEASSHMKQLLKSGDQVQLRRDVEARDRYDRVLAYVYRASDGLFVNLEMVRGGYANKYRYPPNTAHEDQFSEAASAARSGGVGAWAVCEKPFEK